MNEPKQTPRQATGQLVPFRAAVTATVKEEDFPTFTWEILEQQLCDLAVTPSQKALVATLVSATRKQSNFKPAAMVLREVLCIASVLMDETFHAEAGEGEMT